MVPCIPWSEDTGCMVLRRAELDARYDHHHAWLDLHSHASHLTFLRSIPWRNPQGWHTLRNRTELGSMCLHNQISSFDAEHLNLVLYIPWKKSTRVTHLELGSGCLQNGTTVLGVPWTRARQPQWIPQWHCCRVPCEDVLRQQWRKANCVAIDSVFRVWSEFLPLLLPLPPHIKYYTDVVLCIQPTSIDCSLRLTFVNRN